jgi:hypothetical protein
MCLPVESIYTVSQFMEFGELSVLCLVSKDINNEMKLHDIIERMFVRYKKYQVVYSKFQYAELIKAHYSDFPCTTHDFGFLQGKYTYRFVMKKAYIIIVFLMITERIKYSKHIDNNSSYGIGQQIINNVLLKMKNHFDHDRYNEDIIKIISSYHDWT